MSNLQVIWNGDSGEDGLWQDDSHIATIGQLERAGYSLNQLTGMTQKQLATVTRKMTPKPVKLTNRSIEDMLG